LGQRQEFRREERPAALRTFGTPNTRVPNFVSSQRRQSAELVLQTIKQMLLKNGVVKGHTSVHGVSPC